MPLRCGKNKDAERFVDSVPNNAEELVSYGKNRDT
jgi:hypothetical protein